MLRAQCTSSDFEGLSVPYSHGNTVLEVTRIGKIFSFLSIFYFAANHFLEAVFYLLQRKT